MGRTRRALLRAVATGTATAVAACVDPFPDPPDGSVVLTNRDDAAHELTLGARDQERTVRLAVGQQVVVTSLLDGADELRVRLDGGQWRSIQVTGREVHLVVDEDGSLSVTET